VSSYRPVWLGLGAVASDVLIAVVTSVLRGRFGYRAWRVTHWFAYACVPIALVHGLGTGSDAKTNWMLLLTADCVLTVLVAMWIRVTVGWPNHAGIRTSLYG
jgi:methionine sulfoxide reductase heme-binding subunit